MTKNITINWVLNDTPQVCLVFSETEFISSRLSESKLLIYHFILMFSNLEIYFVGKIRSGRLLCLLQNKITRMKMKIWFLQSYLKPWRYILEVYLRQNMESYSCFIAIIKRSIALVHHSVKEYYRISTPYHTQRRCSCLRTRKW